MSRYRRCYASYLYEVVVDNQVKCCERDKELAQVVLEHYLREKRFDNVYLRTIKSIRYTLVD